MELTHCRLFNEVLELLVLGRAVVDLVELAHREVALALFEGLLGFHEQLGADPHLLPEDAFHAGLLRHILARGGALRRSGDDERRPRLVDEDGVHFVDDREGVPALYHLRGVGRHAVVAQVVEAELAIRAVGDVAGILLSALRRAHGVLNAPHG